MLQKNDIVVSRAGSVGVSYLLDDVDNSIFASYLIRFKPLILPKFFYLFLQSPFYWKSIQGKKIGIAIPNVNATRLKQIVIRIPPLHEQRRIVSKIESIFARIEAINNHITTSLERLNTLKSVILNMAFEGRLVPQDPNDESASILLKTQIKKPPRRKNNVK